MKSKQRENIIKPNPKRKMAGEAFVWTPEEEAHIRRWYRKRPVRRIAIELGRGYRAVVMRAMKLGVSRPRRPWTSSQIQKLRSLYRTHSQRHIARLLGLANQDIRYQLKKLGLYRFSWNPQDEKYLLKWYKKKTKPVIARHLRRSLGSVYYRAEILGLVSKRSRFWTAEEDRFLLENYRLRGSAFISRVLGRTRETIRIRAHKKGLSRQRKRKRK